MKKTLWIVLFLLLATPAWSQVPVPYRFTPGTPASATQVNANFDALVAGALNVSGGKVTGNMTVNPGITIDGVDISKVFGDGTNTLTLERASLISTTVPQLTLGYDLTHLMAIQVDANGNASFGLSAEATGFHFSKVVVASAGIRLPANGIECTGCVTGTNMVDQPGLATGPHGNATTVGTFTVDADGRLTAAGDVAIAFPAFPTIPPSYPVGPNTIPESSITNDPTNILARPADNTSITGVWTFTTAPVFPPGMNIPVGDLTSTNYTYNLTSAILNPGGEFARISLMSSYDGSNNPTTGDPAIRFILSTSVATYNPVEIFSDHMSVRGLMPMQPGVTELGTYYARFRTAHFDLPNNPLPDLVVVNKGGAGSDKNTALGYIQAYPGAALQVTKTFGACQVTIRTGLIIDVTGC